MPIAQEPIRNPAASISRKSISRKSIDAAGFRVGFRSRPFGHDHQWAASEDNRNGNVVNRKNAVTRLGPRDRPGWVPVTDSAGSP